MEGSSKRINANGSKNEKDLFHVIHKVPCGDGPYVRAKHAQLVEKDLETAIVWFWKAINAGDRVDSALKDMAVVMKQVARTEEAIEAIRSFRRRCSKQAQESLDNVLIDLYKKCGMVEEQIDLLKRKLRLITKERHSMENPQKLLALMARNFRFLSSKKSPDYCLMKPAGKPGLGLYAEIKLHGSRGCVSESPNDRPRRKQGLQLEPLSDKQARFDEACMVLQNVLEGKLPGSEDCKSRKRAEELLMEVESRQPPPELKDILGFDLEDDDFVKGLQQMMMNGLHQDQKGCPSLKRYLHLEIR
ncbi:hypothetical protein GH714_026216 [Hevea brasiliensis]|uniref:Uncharacterized protein n=1 Tax=Hevea brasiliensis TaxID=3981 RepID=A0A6A6KYW2_HEVBR|nr:hypothetical protein GH714_026216 [Hevea brasiliensis]